MKYKRTHYCGEVSSALEGKEIVVAGFVQRIRDKGALVFIDLRDREGIVQLAFDDQTEPALRALAQTVRAEFVVMAKGVVRIRESINHTMKNGDIELYVSDLDILSVAQTPPFEIVSPTKVSEELRFKHRYLDLRRTELQQAIMMRHKIVNCVHEYFNDNGFLEIETPNLIRATPEGARDYLVPSRVSKGSFYALPQSPQLYKQLLMVSGFDRYFQVARCFRDEDLRADRQPEFTQIDVEMSFVDEDDVMTINEGFVKYVFKKVLDKDIALPLKRMPYHEAMSRFGSDKPDTRFGLELCDISELVKDCGFSVFSGAIAGGGCVRAIAVPGGAEALTRKEIDKLTELAKTYRAKGVAYTRLTPDGETSSFEKFLTEAEIAAIRGRLGAKTGDVILIVADTNEDVVFDALGALRLNIGEKLGLIDHDRYEMLWVTDFPLFEYDAESGRYFAKHHPFTSPNLDDLAMMEADRKNCRARAYDLVVNGTELGGGSIRITTPELQQRMFTALGISEEEATEKFGFLLEAFKYGVPPHGGMAYGLDRLVMLMLKKSSIRDVMAFPKMQNANELMTACPAPVDEKSLDELGIAVKPFKGAND